MTVGIPEPLKVPWDLRDNLSAKSGIARLPDGRTQYWVDEVLTGITPQMLKWWFAGNIAGDMELDGRMVSRYRVWHPFDHVFYRTVRLALDGSFGPGAQVTNLEYLARDPRYKVGGLTGTVDNFGDDGWTYNIYVAGVAIGRMEHWFEKVPQGTRFQHQFYLPGQSIPAAGRILLPLLWRPSDKGEKWLRHGIEEMGNLQNFLPQLYEQETEHPRQLTVPA